MAKRCRVSLEELCVEECRRGMPTPAHVSTRELVLGLLKDGKVRSVADVCKEIGRHDPQTRRVLARLADEGAISSSAKREGRHFVACYSMAGAKRR